jgi:hypothetical protein
MKQASTRLCFTLLGQRTGKLFRDSGVGKYNSPLPNYSSTGRNQAKNQQKPALEEVKRRFIKCSTLGSQFPKVSGDKHIKAYKFTSLQIQLDKQPAGAPESAAKGIYKW